MEQAVLANEVASDDKQGFAVQMLSDLMGGIDLGVALCKMLPIACGRIDFECLYANDAFCEWAELGAVQGAILGQALPGLESSDPQLWGACARVASTRRAETIETSVHGHGQVFSIKLSSPLPECVLAVFEPEAQRRSQRDRLRESEDRFRALVEQNHAVMLQIEPLSGAIVSANEAAARFYGWSALVLEKMSIQDINTMVPEAIAKERLAALEEKRNYFNFKHRLCSGEVRDVEVHSTPVKVAGKPVLISIIHDVTDRLAAQSRLAAALAEQKAMLASKALGVAKVKGRVIEWASAPCEELFGYAPGELAGVGKRVLYESEEDYAEFGRRAYGVLEAGGVFRSEWRLARKDGELGWYDVSCSSMGEGAGESIWSFQDIGARRELEQNRLAAHERMRKIASRVPGVVYEFRLRPDGSSCFPYASDAMSEVYRVEPGEVEHDASKVFETLHPDDLEAVSASIMESSKTLEPWRLDYRVRFKDGEVRWLHGNALPKREEDGSTLWHGFITDITERRATEEMLRTLSTAVEHSPVSIVVTDLNANIEYVNPWFEATTGYKASEVLGKNPRIIQSKLTSPQTYEKMWEELVAGRSWSGEFVNAKKNGKFYWEESRIAPVKDAQGKATHYVAVKSDVSERVVAARRMEALMRDQQSMLANTVVGIAKVRARRIEWCNQALEKILGYESGELAGMSTRVAYPSQEAFEEFGQKAYGILEGGGVFREVVALRKKNGNAIGVDISGDLVDGDSGESIWFFLDISERLAAESALRVNEAKLRSLVADAADAIFVVDAGGRYQHVNRAAIKLLGYSEDEFLNMSIVDITPQESMAETMSQFGELTRTGAMLGELRLLRKDGSVAEVEINASKLPDGTFFGSCRDIGPRKKLEEEIRQLAFRDPLTKLPNRRVMLDRVGAAKEKSRVSGVYSAVVFLDLDNFKPLNDTHGHELGDMLLVEAARRLVASVRSADTVARFGGDEFVVLLDGLGQDRASAMEYAADIGEKIRLEIGKPYGLDGGHGAIPVVHHCTASVGIALFEGSENSVDDVLNLADQAMYRAKEAGRDRVHLARLDGQGEQKPLYI